MPCWSSDSVLQRSLLSDDLEHPWSRLDNALAISVAESVPHRLQTISSLGHRPHRSSSQTRWPRHPLVYDLWPPCVCGDFRLHQGPQGMPAKFFDGHGPRVTPSLPQEKESESLAATPWKCTAHAKWIDSFQRVIPQTMEPARRERMNLEPSRIRLHKCCMII